jgi:hypothetical protein
MELSFAADGTGGGVGSSPETDGAAALLAPNRDLRRLDPELRTRLHRVVERMEKEFGHRVEVVEGYRTPERQAALFAQGRSRPGPVVTWTEESLHSRGKAADLQVDGSWGNPRAYARLQQIAGEEGLETLGPRDAGHVQLPDGLRDGASGTGTAAPSRVVSAPGPVSRTARVARVAAPSGPAPVAAVALPARPGRDLSESGGSNHPLRGAPTDGPIPAVADPPGTPEGAASLGDPVLSRRVAEGSRKSPPSVAASAPKTSGLQDLAADQAAGRRSPDTEEDGSSSAASREPSADSSLSAQGWTQRGGTPAPETRTVEGVYRAGSVDRVSQIQALEEAINARTPGRIHLELDDADGAGTRLRLSLRGSQLAGTVDLDDPAAVLRMKDRVGELHEALSRQGLDARALGLEPQRGVEAGRRVEGDLAALLQDPLAGLGRVMEGRQGTLDARSGRQGDQRGEDQQDAGPFRNPARRDRNKEEGQ